MAKRVDRETGEVFIEDDTPMKPFVWKTPWNHDTAAEAKRTGTICPEKTLTQQSHLEEVEINTVLAKFGIQQVLATTPGGVFVDLPEPEDMAHSFDKLIAARDTFDQLPPGIRQTFETIGQFVEYVDAAVARGDRKALEALNLVAKAPDPTPAPTPAPKAPEAPKPPTP